LGTWFPICLRAAYPALQREPMLPKVRIVSLENRGKPGRDHCPRGISAANLSKCAVAATATRRHRFCRHRHRCHRRHRHRDRHRTIFSPCLTQKKRSARGVSLGCHLRAALCRAAYMRAYVPHAHTPTAQSGGEHGKRETNQRIESSHVVRHREIRGVSSGEGASVKKTVNISISLIINGDGTRCRVASPTSPL